MADDEKYPWSLETMEIINKLTPDIKGKAFDPDWFLLRQRFEEMESRIRRELTEARSHQSVENEQR